MQDHPTILIVDDEPNVRLVLRTALESAGYLATEAPDGATALARLDAEAFDLVILDLRMPVLDGMQTLAKIREQGRRVPVVMLTAHGSIPDAVAAMRLGAIDFLPKPITPAELRAVVAKVIGRTRIESMPAAPVRSFGFELARAKRAINRGEFAEAEAILRVVLDASPDSDEARQILDRLLAMKEREARGAFPLLREWFPGG